MPHVNEGQGCQLGEVCDNGFECAAHTLRTLVVRLWITGTCHVVVYIGCLEGVYRVFRGVYTCTTGVYRCIYGNKGVYRVYTGCNMVLTHDSSTYLDSP